MTFLLDANACINCLRKKGNPLVAQRLGSQPPGAVVLCTVVTAELYHGALVSNDPVGNTAKAEAFIGQFTVLPFDEAAAREYARIRAALQAQGQVIGHLVTMIAAIASVHGLTVVTHNKKDFSRIHPLNIVDWELP